MKNLNFNDLKSNDQILTDNNMGCGSSSTVAPTVVDSDSVIEAINKDTDLDILKKYRKCGFIFLVN